MPNHYDECPDSPLCTHGLPNELGNAGTEGSKDGAVLDAGKTPARNPETVTISRKDAEFCIGMLRGAMTYGRHCEVVWRRLRRALQEREAP
jgi:hypothetical protein